MNRNSIALNLALAISALGLAIAPAQAQTAPALRLSDGTNTITIDANNNITMSSPCACTTTASAGVSGNPGNVNWTGTIGVFSVQAQGNASTTNPDLGVLASNNGSAQATLTVAFTSTGYTGAIISEALPQTNITGSGSVSYYYYSDNTNAVFGTGSLIGSLLSQVLPVSGPVWPTVAVGTYSITEVEAITLAPASSLNGDNELATAPTDLAVTCPTGSGKMSTAYSSTIGATGGNPAYTFSILSGALPPGLSLNASTGAITGTPTAANSYTFSVEVTDSYGSTATSSCGITIALGGGGAQAGGFTLACPSVTGLTQGAYYSSSFVATGGVSPYTFSISAGSLPAGLKLNSSTGAVSGTPLTTAAFSFTGKVVDSTTGTHLTATSSACTGTIAPKPAPLSLSCAANSGQVGVAYSSGAVAAGGTAPYVSYTLTSGSLPPGLTLNASTGAITGTPTKSGNYSYTIQVVDTNGAKASDGSGSGRCSQGCSISISSAANTAPMTLKCPTSSATVGTAYSSAATVTGGTAPYTYSVSGSLPAGLTLNKTTGAITGTPTTPGQANFSVTVVDSTGRTTSSSHYCSGGCSIVVAAAITVGCPTSTGVTGSSYSSTPTVSGGTAPYKWSVYSGSLPNGLSLNSSTGAITGTPTSAGTYSVGLQVTDKNGLVGYSNCTSCSTNINSYSFYCNTGWGSSSNSNSNTPVNCTITISAPANNSQGGGGNNNSGGGGNCGTGNGSGYSGWGW